MEARGSWRARSGALVAGLVVAAAALAVSAAATNLTGDYGPDTCLDGYVWRGAVPSDHVCVTPDIRTQAAQDNAQAAARWAGSGPFGPHTCLNGFVWREAFDGDDVCVVPPTRDQARSDNANAANRRNELRIAVSTYYDNGARFRFRSDRINTGPARVYLFGTNGKTIKSWPVFVSKNPSGLPGGYLSLRTGMLQCVGAANAYFRVKDGSSGRWSSREYVTTGCATY